MLLSAAAIARRVGWAAPMLIATHSALVRKIVGVTERDFRLTGYHPRELLSNVRMWLDQHCEHERSRLAE